MKDVARVGGVIISHGQVANELVAAAEAVVGDVANMTAVSIGWHDDVELAKGEIERSIKQVSNGAGVLLLTDMFGGTPTNIATVFFKENEVEIVTGVNLPMVIKLATVSEPLTLSELAAAVESEGRSSICRAGELLLPQKMKKDA
jgi:PTS system mannose-specific IIA component